MIKKENWPIGLQKETALEIEPVVADFEIETKCIQFCANYFSKYLHMKHDEFYIKAETHETFIKDKDSSIRYFWIVNSEKCVILENTNTSFNLHDLTSEVALSILNCSLARFLSGNSYSASPILYLTFYQRVFFSFY